MSYNGPFLNTVDTKGKLQSSVSPSADNDLANKSYVDTQIAKGGGDFLASALSVEANPLGLADGRYIVAASNTAGSFVGKENNVVDLSGGNQTITVVLAPSATVGKGTHIFNEATGQSLVWSSSSEAWVTNASANGALIAANNLSDIGNSTTARSNLGLGSLAVADSVALNGTSVTGTLGLDKGGTGQDATQAAGKKAAFDALSPLTTGGDLLYHDGSNNVRLGKGSDGQVLGLSSGIPAWQNAGGSGTVTSVAIATDSGNSAAVTASGTISVIGASGSAVSTAAASGAVAISVADATATVKGLAKFSTDDFSVSSGNVTIKSAGVDLTSQVTGTLPAANGGTGLTSIATLLNSNVTAATLGLVIGTDVQAYNAKLASLAGLSANNNGFIVGNGSTFTEETPANARASLGFDTADNAITNLGFGNAAKETMAPNLAGVGGNVLKVANGASLSASDLLAIDANGDIVAGTAGGSGTVTSITPGADTGSGTAITTSGTISVKGSGTVSTSVAGSDITVAVAAATTSALGLASFSSSSFDVSSGAVSIKSGGINLTTQVVGVLGASNGGLGSTTYGDFSDPIRLDTAVYTTAQSLSPANMQAIQEVVILNLEGVTSTSTIQLPTPAASDVGRSIEVKLMKGMVASGASANHVTVSVANSGKMDDETSIQLDQNFQRLRFTAISSSNGAVNYALG